MSIASENPYLSPAPIPSEAAGSVKLREMLGYGCVAGLMTGSLFGGVGVALFCAVACTRFWWLEGTLDVSVFLQSLLLIAVSSFIFGALVGGIMGLFIGPLVSFLTAVTRRHTRTMICLSGILCAIAGAVPGAYMFFGRTESEFFLAILGMAFGAVFGALAGVRLATQLAKFYSADVPTVELAEAADA